jgi:hypothetical protein
MARLNPYLQKMSGPVWRGIDLTVSNSLTSAHDLHFTRAKDTAISKAILML